MKKILLLLSVVLLAGCDYPIEEYHTTPRSYGSGVFYFPVAEERFSQSLAEWRKKNTCDIVAVTGDGNGVYGRDQGYWVICKEI